MSGSESFYDKSSVTSIEQAVLAEDLYFSEIKNIEGKFFIKVLTPMVDSTKLATKNKAGMTSSNYITLVIPAYILLHFANVTPTTIKVPTKMNPDTGNPTAYQNYNVLSYSFKSEAADSAATKTTSKTTTKKKTTAKTATNQFCIPQGTIFFVEFLGGLVDADKTYIVGVSQFSLIQE